MADFDVVLNGDRAIALRFDRLPILLKDRLQAVMTDLIQRIAAAQRAQAPRGKTGRLAASVGHVFVETGPEFIRARSTVVTDQRGGYAKAGALEYGVPGRKRGARLIQVTEHLRRNPYGGPGVLVDRYYRMPRIIAQRYLRGPFDAMRDQIEAEIRDAVDQAVSESEAA
jgi:hypothetical protein